VYWQAEGVTKGQTMVLVSMILFELLRAFSCRSMQFTIVQLGFFSNRWLVLANLSSALLMVAVIYIPSWATAFHTVSIGLSDWGVALGVGGAGFLVVEGGKWLAARRCLTRVRPTA
jgi:Ca2+-transporting ATPase